jgi:hypothetical protein
MKKIKLNLKNSELKVFLLIQNQNTSLKKVFFCVNF